MTGVGGHTSGPVANDKVVDGHSRLQFSTLLDMTWNKTDSITQLKMVFFPDYFNTIFVFSVCLLDLLKTDVIFFYFWFHFIF